MDGDFSSIVDMIPREQRELWGRVIQHVYATVAQTPAYAELLFETVCEFLHYDGSRHLLHENGLAKVNELAATCMQSGAPLIQCRAAELLRSTILMTGEEDTAGVWPVIRSGFLLPRAPNAALTGVRNGVATMLLQCLSAAMGATAQQKSRVQLQVPHRIMSALCAAIYVDPQGCAPHLQQPFDGSGKAGFQLFVEYWEANRGGQMFHDRVVDMTVSIMAIACVLQIYHQQASVPLATMAPLLNAGAALAMKCRVSAADGERDDLA